MKPEQNAKGRFIPGSNGGNGRPRGARGKLGEDFLEALHANFLAHGADAIDVVRIEKPDAYLKIIASILPKHLELRESAFDGVSDHELSALVAAAREALAANESDGEQAEPEAEASPDKRTH